MMGRIAWKLLPAAPALAILFAWWVYWTIVQPPPSVIPSILDVVRTGAELAFGGRWCAGASSPPAGGAERCARHGCGCCWGWH